MDATDTEQTGVATTRSLFVVLFFLLCSSPHRRGLQEESSVPCVLCLRASRRGAISCPRQYLYLYLWGYCIPLFPAYHFECPMRTSSFILALFLIVGHLCKLLSS
jgi:hypothetical protein